eukprot:TRINITY_DN7712_c0_g2_i1.p1 TRINITY_DN7712_c0_g2~~TRINITY_DN7712_c0_g2_i1.p1  ORF type:complete len:1195 (+),score=196.19 TRINITY_DN7712_c0_g2_i1:24-3608(+)
MSKKLVKIRMTDVQTHWGSPNKPLSSVVPIAAGCVLCSYKNTSVHVLFRVSGETTRQEVIRTELDFPVKCRSYSYPYLCYLYESPEETIVELYDFQQNIGRTMYLDLQEQPIFLICSNKELLIQSENYLLYLDNLSNFGDPDKLKFIQLRSPVEFYPSSVKSILLGKKVILVGTQNISVIDIHKGVSIIKMRSNLPLIRVVHNKDYGYIYAFSMDYLYIWEISSRNSITSIPLAVSISAILSYDRYLIVGDVHGQISVLNYQNGLKISDVNTLDENLIRSEMSIHQQISDRILSIDRYHEFIVTATATYISIWSTSQVCSEPLTRYRIRGKIQNFGVRVFNYTIHFISNKKENILFLWQPDMDLLMSKSDIDNAPTLEMLQAHFPTDGRQFISTDEFKLLSNNVKSDVVGYLFNDHILFAERASNDINVKALSLREVAIFLGTTKKYLKLCDLATDTEYELYPKNEGKIYEWLDNLEELISINISHKYFNDLQTKVASNEDNVKDNTRIFGISFQRYLSISGGNSDNIPYILKYTVDNLLDRGTSVRKLFVRSEEDMKNIYKQLNQGTIELESITDVHKLADVLKYFLLTSPTSLIPQQIGQLMSTQKPLENTFLKVYIACLPDVYRLSLYHIMGLLRVIYSSKINVITLKMLSNIFQPLIMKGLRRERRKYARRTIIQLIEFYDIIFDSSYTLEICPSFLKELNSSNILLRTSRIIELLENIDNLSTSEDRGELHNFLDDFYQSFSSLYNSIESIDNAMDNWLSICKIVDYRLLDKLISQITIFIKYIESEVNFGKQQRLEAEKSFLRMNQSINTFTANLYSLFSPDTNIRKYNTVGSRSQSHRSNVTEPNHSIDTWLKYHVHARDMWISAFGKNAYMVPWDDFVAVLKDSLRYNIKKEMRYLKYLLDYSGTNFVNASKFSQFLISFGPLHRSIKNLRQLLSQACFCGYLERIEIHRFLETEEEGTYLIRVKKNSLHNIGLYYVKMGETQEKLFKYKKLLIDESGFRFRKGTYKTLGELLQSETKLKIPFESPFSRCPYFHGKIQLKKVEELFKSEPPGTFLAAFSVEEMKISMYNKLEGGNIFITDLKRLDKCRLEFEGTEYEDINKYVEDYEDIFRHPFSIMKAMTSSTSNKNMKDKFGIQKGMSFRNDKPNKNKRKTTGRDLKIHPNRYGQRHKKTKRSSTPKKSTSFSK